MSGRARPGWIAVLALAALLALSGCGMGPYGEGGKAPSSDGGPAQEVMAGDGMDAPTRVNIEPHSLKIYDTDLDVDGDAEQAAAAYGLAYANWSWRTYADQYAAMAGYTTGRFKRDLLANRPTKRVMEVLAAGEQMNLATLVATDTVASNEVSRTVIVVMRERSVDKSITDPAPHHAVYRAKVVQTDVGWRLSAWTLLQ